MEDRDSGLIQGLWVKGRGYAFAMMAFCSIFMAADQPKAKPCSRWQQMLFQKKASHCICMPFRMEFGISNVLLTIALIR